MCVCMMSSVLSFFGHMASSLVLLTAKYQHGGDHFWLCWGVDRLHTVRREVTEATEPEVCNILVL